MKGAMFTGFADWVEHTRGLGVLDELLVGLGDQLVTGGAYTSVGNYPSQELHALAGALASREGRDEDAVLIEYGEAAFAILAAQAPDTVASCANVYELLGVIESVIHTQVRKLDVQARPPLISVRLTSMGELEVTYSSHREFTAMCHGLIVGAARWFDSDADVRVISTKHVDDVTTSVFAVTGWRRV